LLIDQRRQKLPNIVEVLSERKTRLPLALVVESDVQFGNGPKEPVVEVPQSFHLSLPVEVNLDMRVRDARLLIEFELLFQRTERCHAGVTTQSVKTPKETTVAREPPAAASPALRPRKPLAPILS